MTTVGSMAVRCLLFGRYAELLGTEAILLEVADAATVAEAVDCLRRTHANGLRLPERPLVAVNREHVAHECVLAPGDEMALLPPLAGG